MRRTLVKVFLLVLLFITSVLIAGGTTVYVWDFPAWSVDGDNYAWIKSMMREYSANHPGVSFKLTEIPWAGGDKKLDLAVASRNWPDITRGPLKAHYVVQGVLVAIDEYINEDDYYEPALKGATFNGKIYGFPFYMTTKVVMINREIFKERGVRIPTFEDPWTFEEFAQALEKLTYDKDGDGKIDIYGFAASAMPPDNAHLWPFLLANGGKIIEEENGNLRCVVNTPENAEILRYLAGIFKKYAPPYMAAYGDADAYNIFKSGRAAVYISGTWAIPPIRRAGIDIDVVPFPVKKKGDRFWSFGDVSSYQIFIQKDPKKLSVLIDFAKTITSVEQQKKLVEYGQFPTLKSVGNIYEGDEAMTKAAIISQYNFIFPPHPAKDKAIEKISQQIQLALLERISPEDALKNAEKAANRILLRGGK